MAKYRDTKNYTDYLKNLENANTDIVLTALIQYYAKDYISGLNIDPFINDDNNLFEQYLLASANKKTVLTDLLQLKEEKDNLERWVRGQKYNYGLRHPNSVCCVRAA